MEIKVFIGEDVIVNKGDLNIEMGCLMRSERTLSIEEMKAGAEIYIETANKLLSRVPELAKEVMSIIEEPNARMTERSLAQKEAAIMKFQESMAKFGCQCDPDHVN
jgi:hypothetical protein